MATTQPVTLRRFLTLTGRAMALRCPRCGGGSLFRSWWALKPACPSCGFALDRGEPDFWIGGYAVNIVAAELLVTILLVALAVATWPDVPWALIQYGGVALALGVPILFFPVSRVLWLAWDFCFRPDRD
ncbi:MAG: DUF983 domain-containing protein [Gemmatimonadaceae bacterium]|nr:DUF983 domain-containing protein [Gemmatimonadaceae bacterium]